MRRWGRKGEVTGERAHFYLKKAFRDLVRSYAKQLGRSQSDVLEELIVIGDNEFRRKYGIGSEEDKSDKEMKKADMREEAVKLAGKELVRYAQESSERRFMQDIYFGKHSVSDMEKSLLEIEPESIWERFFGRFRKQDERWEQVE